MTDKYNLYARVLIVILLFSACYFPAFAGMASKWSSSENYSHAFIIVPIIIFMFWVKRNILFEGDGAQLVGLVLLVSCIGVYLVALRIQIPSLIFLATYLTIISAIIYIAGIKAIAELFLPLLVLLLIIPIPPTILSTVTASLQLLISRLTESLFHLSVVPLLREGNIIYIPGKSLQVIDACSGIRSLLAMTTIALIVSFFSLKNKWNIAILFASSCIIAIFLNILRMALIITAFYCFKVDLTVGVKHSLMGVTLFLCGYLFICLFKNILKQWERKLSYS